MEAVIGAVTYHRSHEESIRATGYVCGDNDNQMNTVLAAYVRGYQPESVYHHITDDIVLSEIDKQYVEELEKYQRYINREIVLLMNRYKYQDKRLALQSLTSAHPKSSFNY